MRLAADVELEEAVKLLRRAERKLKGTNVMGGCSSCGSAVRGQHSPRCLIMAIRRFLIETSKREKRA